MSASLPIPATQTAARTKIVVVKSSQRVVLSRREGHLRNLNYIEAQLNTMRNQMIKLAQIAHDMRAEIAKD